MQRRVATVYPGALGKSPTAAAKTNAAAEATVETRGRTSVLDLSEVSQRRVKAFVRVRPLIELELRPPATAGGDTPMRGGSSPPAPAQSVISVGTDGKSIKIEDDSPMVFDAVFEPTTPLQTICSSSVVPAVKDVLSGVHSAILLYGQTGAGKTHTLEQLFPTMMASLFRVIELESDTYDTTVSMECVQIYLETIFDLIDTSRTHLQLREFPDTGVFVRDASVIPVKDLKDVEKVWLKACSNRSFASTALNRESSRSHCIYTVHVKRRRRLTREQFSSSRDASRHHNSTQNLSASATAASFYSDAGAAATLQGRLSIVDLAGSERLKRSHSEGARKVEAQYINQSISALGKVMHSLTQANIKHVPYRDSKLTRLLQDALGGSGTSSIIVNVSPANTNAAETRQTLSFGMRAMKIVTTITTWKAVDGTAGMAATQDWLESRVHFLEARLQMYERAAAGGPASKSKEGCSCCATNKCSLLKLQVEEQEAEILSLRKQLDCAEEDFEQQMARYRQQLERLNNDCDYYKERSSAPSKTEEENATRQLDAVKEYYQSFIAAQQEECESVRKERDESQEELLRIVSTTHELKEGAAYLQDQSKRQDEQRASENAHWVELQAALKEENGSLQQEVGLLKERLVDMRNEYEGMLQAQTGEITCVQALAMKHENESVDVRHRCEVLQAQLESTVAEANEAITQSRSELEGTKLDAHSKGCELRCQLERSGFENRWWAQRYTLLQDLIADWASAIHHSGFLPLAQQLFHAEAQSFELLRENESLKTHQTTAAEGLSQAEESFVSVLYPLEQQQLLSSAKREFQRTYTATLEGFVSLASHEVDERIALLANEQGEVHERHRYSITELFGEESSGRFTIAVDAWQAIELLAYEFSSQRTVMQEAEHTAEKQRELEKHSTAAAAEAREIVAQFEAEHKQRAGSLAGQLQEQAQLVEEAKAEVQRQTARNIELSEECEELQQLLKDWQRVAQERKISLDEVDVERERWKELKRGSEGAEHSLHRRLKQADAEIRTLTQDLTETSRELNAKEAALMGVELKVQALQQEKEDLAERLAELVRCHDQEEQALRFRLEQAEHRSEERREECSSVQDTVMDLQADIAALEGQLDQKEFDHKHFLVGMEAKLAHISQVDQLLLHETERRSALADEEHAALQSLTARYFFYFPKKDNSVFSSPSEFSSGGSSMMTLRHSLYRRQLRALDGFLQGFLLETLLPVMEEKHELLLESVERVEQQRGAAAKRAFLSSVQGLQLEDDRKTLALTTLHETVDSLHREKAMLEISVLALTERGSRKTIEATEERERSWLLINAVAAQSQSSLRQQQREHQASVEQREGRLTQSWQRSLANAERRAKEYSAASEALQQRLDEVALETEKLQTELHRQTLSRPQSSQVSVPAPRTPDARRSTPATTEVESPQSGVRLSIEKLTADHRLSLERVEDELAGETHRRCQAEAKLVSLQSENRTLVSANDRISLELEQVQKELQSQREARPVEPDVVAALEQVSLPSSKVQKVPTPLVNHSETQTVGTRTRSRGVDAQFGAPAIATGGTPLIVASGSQTVLRGIGNELHQGPQSTTTSRSAMPVAREGEAAADARTIDAESLAAVTQSIVELKRAIETQQRTPSRSTAHPEPTVDEEEDSRSTFSVETAQAIGIEAVSRLTTTLSAFSSQNAKLQEENVSLRELLSASQSTHQQEVEAVQEEAAVVAKTFKRQLAEVTQRREVERSSFLEMEVNTRQLGKQLGQRTADFQTLSSAVRRIKHFFEASATLALSCSKKKCVLLSQQYRAVTKPRNDIGSPPLATDREKEQTVVLLDRALQTADLDEQPQLRSHRSSSVAVGVSPQRSVAAVQAAAWVVHEATQARVRTVTTAIQTTSTPAPLLPVDTKSQSSETDFSFQQEASAPASPTSMADRSSGKETNEKKDSSSLTYGEELLTSLVDEVRLQRDSAVAQVEKLTLENHDLQETVLDLEGRCDVMDHKNGVLQIAKEELTLRLARAEGDLVRANEVLQLAGSLSGVPVSIQPQQRGAGGEVEGETPKCIPKRSPAISLQNTANGKVPVPVTVSPLAKLPSSFNSPVHLWGPTHSPEEKNSIAKGLFISRATSSNAGSEEASAHSRSPSATPPPSGGGAGQSYSDPPTFLVLRGSGMPGGCGSSGNASFCEPDPYEESTLPLDVPPVAPPGRDATTAETGLLPEAPFLSRTASPSKSTAYSGSHELIDSPCGITTTTANIGANDAFVWLEMASGYCRAVAFDLLNEHYDVLLEIYAEAFSSIRTGGPPPSVVPRVPVPVVPPMERSPEGRSILAEERLSKRDKSTEASSSTPRGRSLSGKPQPLEEAPVRGEGCTPAFAFEALYDAAPRTSGSRWSSGGEQQGTHTSYRGEVHKMSSSQLSVTSTASSDATNGSKYFDTTDDECIAEVVPSLTSICRCRRCLMGACTPTGGACMGPWAKNLNIALSRQLRRKRHGLETDKPLCPVSYTPLTRTEEPLHHEGGESFDRPSGKRLGASPSPTSPPPPSVDAARPRWR